MRFLAFLAFLFVLAGPARADRFEYPGQGFAIDGPDGWVIMTISDMNRVHRDNDFGSEELNRSIRSGDPAHLLTITATRTPVGVSPGLHLFYREGRLAAAEDYLNALVGYLALNTEEFRMLSRPEAVSVGGFEAGFVTYRYTAQANARPLVVEETVWVVPMDDHFLLISTGTAPDDEAGKRQIRQTVATLRRFP